ncbi:hypothetical protein [Anabaena sp. AL93]|nr:hypothetical protein [Anabaena sp. AL93]
MPRFNNADNITKAMIINSSINGASDRSLNSIIWIIDNRALIF